MTTKKRTPFWLDRNEKMSFKKKSEELGYSSPSQLLQDLATKPFIFLSGDIIKAMQK